MLVVASENGLVGLPVAMALLRQGASAVEAVEAGIRCVEDNEAEHSVGRGGSPTLLGQVELDASIMAGRTLRCGAVAAMRGYAHPISVARQVMERLPYALLVGPGAEMFAAECGFQREELLTAERFQDWQDRLSRVLTAENRARLVRQEGLIEATQALVAEIARGHGTTNLIAMDGQGDIAAGVSTSGLALKFPGRVGDSPIVGAGNYADNRYGAATCTGFGEMAIRASTAHSVVAYMRAGMALVKAAEAAMVDLQVLDLPWPGNMNLVAIDARGNHCGISTRPDRHYLYMTDEMAEPASAPRHCVPLDERTTG